MSAESPRARFYRIVSEAMRDIGAHGFDSQERVERWMFAIQGAARVAQVPMEEVTARLGERLTREFNAALSPKRLGRVHPGVKLWTVEQMKPELRTELRRRILASANLIKLDREASIQRTLSRFAGWASSVPIGGIESSQTREDASEVHRGIAGLPFVERRVVIDQGHKLVAAVDDVIARDEGAVAATWRHVHQQPGYDPRPEHVARNGRLYLLRDSWAHREGLVKPDRYGFFEDLDERPGEAIFCRCWAQYVYGLDRLPRSTLTAKGRAWLARAEAKLREVS